MEALLHPTQTAFLRGRQIVEGFYYAQEVITEAKKKKQRRQIIIFKADIFKAFDSLS
jgi:hypothetical protein